MNILHTLLLAAALACLAGCAAQKKTAGSDQAGGASKTAGIAAAEPQDPYIKQREQQRAAREKSKARSLAQTRKMIADRIAARDKAARKANAGTTETDPQRNPPAGQGQ